MSDGRRWTLSRRHPMTTMLDGPRLDLGESVEVVPAAALDVVGEALEPFAEWAAAFDGVYPADDEENAGQPMWHDEEVLDVGLVRPAAEVTVGDVRRARAALGNKKREVA